MGTAYDTWKTTQPDDDGRDEAVAERAAELTAERIQQDAPVKSAIETLLSDDYDGVWSDHLRGFFLAANAAKTDAELAESALRLSALLRPCIQAEILAYAMVDATTEYDRALAERHVMRDEMRDAA